MTEIRFEYDVDLPAKQMCKLHGNKLSEIKKFCQLH